MNLIEELRPKDFEDFVGQDHLFSKGGMLRRYLLSGSFPSSILFGPPGCGKTSTLNLIKRYTNYEIFHLEAPSTGVSEIKKIVDVAKRGIYDKRILLFLEEFHHVSRRDQRLFLEPVEKGYLILVGTTTESPYRYVIEPLLSRMRVFKFRRLDEKDVLKILKKALERLGEDMDLETLEEIAISSGGDARLAILNLQEVLEGGKIDEKNVLSRKEHYDLISAFIKSVRGSDPDAAIYYLARLLELGEDPRFIARRLVILASEDIGLADSKALLIAVSAAQAVEIVGMPEAEINLAHATLYLSLAPKSNSSYEALRKAKEVALKNARVPDHLKNIPGSGYVYPHDFGGYVKQRYLPFEIEGKFYLRKEIGEEKDLGRWRDEDA